MGVGHWTGGEAGRDPDEQVVRVIRSMKWRTNALGLPSPLSIHFVIDSDGVCWQCADPATVVALHAGAVNEESIGIEVVNGGLPSFAASYRPRDRVFRRLRGRAVEQLAFFGRQLEAYADLCEVLSSEFGIPRVVPGMPIRDVRGRLVSDRIEVADRMLPPEAIRTFSGFLEHLHVHKATPDGGTQLSWYLSAMRGYAVHDVERGMPRTLLGL